MSGSFEDDGTIDPHRGIIIDCFGKKRSGKSIMGLLWFRSYAGDKVVIDVAGDDGPIGPDVIELHGTVDDLPRRWPEHERQQGPDGRPLPMILRYVPDAGSSTVLEDMDTVVGLAMSGDTPRCILVHEVGRLAIANRTPPHTSRLLAHNRHNGATTAIFCGPRPKTIDPLVLAQADLGYFFDIPNPADRLRIAEEIGWPVADFTTAMEDLGPHEYLRFDANEPKPADGEKDYRLVHFVALPGDVVDDVKRWAGGWRPPAPNMGWA